MRGDHSGRRAAGVPAQGLGRLVLVREPDVLELEPGARVAAAAVELHRHRRRRRALDVHVRHVADPHP